jgi:hypothetical protein
VSASDKIIHFKGKIEENPEYDEIFVQNILEAYREGKRRQGELEEKCRQDKLEEKRGHDELEAKGLYRKAE